ncbi:alkaline phosphatase D family protein [Gordonia polyisoprenivorans]|uniref:alkaline phosphatase D family protein n=1 Tax=Gordonia polyisoprenivorans TaxID=84595 RepID=UPI0030CE97F6
MPPGSVEPSTSTRSAGTPTRRELLRAAAIGALVLPTGSVMAGRASAAPTSPGLLRPRPRLTHGVAAGDQSASGAVVWARSDSPARMIVETSATETFRNTRTFTGPLLTPLTDGTGRVRVAGLPPGQTVHYRVRLEGPTGAVGEPVTGMFRTAQVTAGDVHFLWSGDVVGQGWGINPDIGGLPVFGVMADRVPDFFIHSGDAIYADNTINPTQKQNNGQLYRNVTTPAKAHVAQTVDDFRGNYAYNLTDGNYRRFAASVGQLIQWDDHEVLNNWYPGENLTGQKRDGYTQTDVNTLARNARQAWREWQPVSEATGNRVYRKVSHGPLLDVFLLDMRTYKDPNPANWSTTDDGGILGAEQTRWLIDSLRSSRATWKVIANDLPISIVVADALSDPRHGPKSMEAVAQGDPGAPRGREIAFSKVLSQTKNVTGKVFLTADVHYTAAISYEPDRATFRDFSPFWEFVSGPLHAGAFPVSPLDATFGPRYEYVHAPQKANTSPAEGFQHFGEVRIAKDTKVLTVDLCDSRGQVLYTKELTP